MGEPVATNIKWHHGEVTPEQRRARQGHRGAVLWFTGLSGSGKSTLSNRVERRLHERGIFTYVLDGDNIRHGLNADLGFSPSDREENIRRIGEVARLFVDAGAIVLSAFISPYRGDRQKVRDRIREGAFVEVYLDVDVATCESRDPKGLYKKARAGEIQGFTGIDAPYEAPESPELRVDTGAMSLDDAADKVVGWLEANGYLVA